MRHADGGLGGYGSRGNGSGSPGPCTSRGARFGGGGRSGLMGPQFRPLMQPPPPPTGLTGRAPPPSYPGDGDTTLEDGTVALVDDSTAASMPTKAKAMSAAAPHHAATPLRFPMTSNCSESARDAGEAKQFGRTSTARSREWTGDACDQPAGGASRGGRVGGGGRVGLIRPQFKPMMQLLPSSDRIVRPIGCNAASAAQQQGPGGVGSALAGGVTTPPRLPNARANTAAPPHAAATALPV
jgi:hypothetical protein